jgi:drug/metabolite transporter (DMT)-like permease
VTGLAVVRIWLPAATAVAGVVLVIVGDDIARGAGIVLIGVAALVVLANLFIRLALSSERDRGREQQRRRFFARHGRWPDEPPP